MGIALIVTFPKVSLAPLPTLETLPGNGFLGFGKTKTQPLLSLSSSSILVSAGLPEHIVSVPCLALPSKAIVRSVLSLLTLAKATVAQDGLTCFGADQSAFHLNLFLSVMKPLCFLFY